MTALPRPAALNLVLSRLQGVRQSGDSWQAHCPAHEDRKPSLQVDVGEDGRILVHCFAGCSFESVVHALSLDARDLGPEAPSTLLFRDLPSGCREIYEYRSEQGELMFQVCRMAPRPTDSKPFRQRRPYQNTWAWGLSAGRYKLGRDKSYRKLGEKESLEGSIELAVVEKILYRLPELRRAMDAGEWIVVCEGEKDANRGAAIGLATTTNPGGAKKWQPSFSRALSGARVAIVPDNDPPGKESGELIFRSLRAEGIEARIVDLGGTTKGYDLADWIDAQKASGRSEDETRAALFELIEAAAPLAGHSSTKPQILISTDQVAVVDQALAALATRPEIFQRYGRLVHIVQEVAKSPGCLRQPEAPMIVPAPQARLRELLSDAATWIGPNANLALPPNWAVDTLLARGSWPQQRPLEGVIECPVVRADGSILVQPGYDEATGLLYLPQPGLGQIAVEPTLEAAQWAADRLLDLVADFPFATAAHRSAWLAALLTCLGRYAFTGPSPLFLVDSNVRGSGKSLLVDVVSMIAFGRPAPRTCGADSATEERKRIMAIALAGDPLVMIDNVAGSLGSPALDAALTGNIWSDRILGSSTQVKIPLRMIWMATGNNVELRGDLCRRCVHIRLESPEERPELREDFRYPRLLEWASTHRAELIGAGLTILSAYIKAGKPDQDLSPWGSFEGWSEEFRGAIVWVGEVDPGDTREELQTDADQDSQQLDRLLEGWTEITESLGRPVSVAEAFTHLENDPNAFPILRSVLAELSRTPGQLPSAHTLGVRLRKTRGRMIEGRCFQAVGKRSRCGQVWAVVQVGKSPSNASPM